MLCTFFVKSVEAGTAVVAVVGAAWACAMWAPFAVIGEELAGFDEDSNEGAKDGMRGRERASVGATMGLHNVVIAAPQILAALVCSFLFKLFELLGVEDGFGWVLRAAGMASLGAVWVGWG
jgi:solute carrier family 45 protein 1/2/4